MARTPTTRGMRDEAEVGPSPKSDRELRRLSELRYQVADGEPDVRGWRVYASTGRELGTVSDLLVDTDAGEVVMLDIDLRRDDRHTLAPVRAVWIDHATKRVVLDAREAAQVDATAAAPTGAPAATADTDSAIPALPRAGALDDAEVRRFNADYARAYGDRGVDAERGYRLRRGDEELRFAAGPRRLLDPGAPAPAALSAGAPPSAVPAAPARGSDEAADINATLADANLATARQEAGATKPAAPGPSTPGSNDLAAAVAAADARFAQPAERRQDRVDDASGMDDAQAIDPRELDARVRIDEGGTVDDRTPVAAVRYDTPGPVHGYGEPNDTYGSGGSGRIGFDHVSRGPYTAGEAPAPADAAPPAGETRPVRYRSYDDRYAGPGGGR